MGKRIGVICVFLGILCLLSAIGLAVYNGWEDQNAGEQSQTILTELESIMDGNTTVPENTEALPEDPGNPPAEMATVKVDGYDCLGILSIPALDLKLPVLTQWSYAKLKKAPCHYYGSYYTKDFVIAAHNYRSHFGRLSQLQAGDVVVFTDANGVDHGYKVVLLETLPKDATQEMIASGFALSLYTCTPGGASRVTVRCDAIC